MTQEPHGPGMVPLDQFVTARLDEDEWAAAACHPGEWFTAYAFEYGLTDLSQPTDGRTHPTPELDADSTHAARHSSAPVFAMFAAHRRLLERYCTARTPMQGSAFEASVKAFAGIYAEHDDYNLTWGL